MKISLNPSINSKIPNIMKWTQIYLIVTVLLYLFGPIKYVLHNTGMVLLLLAIYQLSLCLGYELCMHKSRTASENEIISAKQYGIRDKLTVRKIIILGIIFDFLMIVRMSNTINPFMIVSKVMSGIMTPATRYADYFADSSAGNLAGGSVFSFIVTIGSPLAIAAIILGIYYFSELRAGDRILLLICIVFHLSTQFLSGANEGIFDFVIYFVVAMFMKTVNLGISIPIKEKKPLKWKIILIVAGAAVIAAALVFFTYNVIGRTAGNFAFTTLGENQFNPDAGINKYIPKSMLVTFTYLSVYLSEGYYGFSLTTMLGWVPMFGTGFSSFIRNNISELFNYDLFGLSYQKRIESIAEWGALRNFHTSYTFWANDVSLIGVPVIMFIMGYLIGIYYRRCVIKCKKTAIVMMPLLITFILYLPANNKVFVQPSSFLLFFFIIIYDLFEGKISISLFRRRKKYEVR